MPMVASNGAMRADPCNGRSPNRSMPSPITTPTAITIRMVSGSGVASWVEATKPA